MEESTLVPRSRSSQQVDLVDDECSTDSGCSSGGSTGSAEILSRRGSAELRHYQLLHSSASGGGRSRGRSTNGQERLKQRKAAAAAAAAFFKPKSSRSWSPEERGCGGKYRACGHSILKSPSHSQSPSDTPSSDSDSLKRSSTARSLRKAFQNFKISTNALSPAVASEKNNNNNNNNAGSGSSSSSSNNNEKSGTKKCQKRILRSPVAYTYVKGLSGLPTQRIPRNAV